MGKTHDRRHPSVLWFLAVCVAGCSSRIEPADPEPGDRACAEDEAAEEQAARAGEGLPWDIDGDLDSDRPVCPADQPDCDRLDEPDTIEADLASHDLDGITLDADAVVPYGLTDPLTSTGRYRTWPGGRIPYRYAKTSAGSYQVNYTTRERVSQAMTNWERLTEGRIKFRPKLASDTAYVIIKEGSPRVSPFVGYRKDRVQEMYLRDSEYITVIKHELGHVVGLHHEQRRTDRLNHIKVRTWNIVDTTSCRYQFSTCSDCVRVGSYDRSSVMHYRTTDLANCRTGPVLLKLDNTYISHYWQLSARDLDVVARMYPLTAVPTDDVLPESGSLVAGGTCLGVADGGALQSKSCDGAGDQDWRATLDGQLRVQHSLQCAAVAGCSAPGALVEQAACSPTAPDQKWTFSGMQIVNGATGACLEAGAAGAPIASADCRGAAAQAFDYDAATETLRVGALCVTGTDAAADGDAVTLAACDGRASQQWFQGRGGFVTRANTARCLRVPAGGATVELGDCSDDIDQRWALRGAIRDARGGLCLQGSETAGTQLALAACDGSADQTWTFWSR